MGVIDDTAAAVEDPRSDRGSARGAAVEVTEGEAVEVAGDGETVEAAGASTVAHAASEPTVRAAIAVCSNRRAKRVEIVTTRSSSFLRG
jgi:hypothetical protein